ncbi:NADP-dependent oxidoreductase [Stackebrandtia nassauensis]|uniref:Alcohol dehydrogenase zinc-binding domain protein n=1 Tax=Stackebrandtia nassauensis (strain DSM 44728 / CIP 108903 / NRRL B-16338 / NBRC 102104 / LLR-40K-21) TaxID=446470 RepID=D3Q8Y8_STANL|nr:NADP-dependent oxidoreductase [Stackebrandtia nassauensis]ADD40597.1 Alcohol dehydrogenase zinc-binding domain protein [Stackebrandtia nassauensis DSM 44728]
MPKTMRAISQNELGGPEVLRLIETTRPEPGYGEVLVRVHAAGVNPVDPAARETGLYIGKPPFILGWDVSGVVEEVGIGVTRFRVGDEVYGMPRFPHIAAAHAEYLTSPARHLDHKPKGLTHTEAAAIPLVGLTAWQALVDTANLRAGETVLVHAAAGAIGQAVIQIAKHLGATVIGTARAARHDFLRDLGADQLIDYTTTDFTDIVNNVDVALSPLGGDYATRTISVIRDGGRYVELQVDNHDAKHPEATARDITTTGFMLVEPDLAGMQALSRLVTDHGFNIHVGRTLPLAQAAEAHRLLRSKDVHGKIILTVD